MIFGITMGDSSGVGPEIMLKAAKSGELRQRYRLAVVSNFDYSPTCLMILERAGIAPLFETIVISDEVGWRKPHPDIFAEAFRRTGADPARTLFVGDRLDIDVVGAHRAGMDAAWLSPGGEGLPPDAVAPRYVIRDLAELEAIVEA